MKLLHIDSSILGEASVSRAVSRAVVDHLVAGRGDVEVATRDLARAPLSHLSGAYLAGHGADTKHDQAEQEDIALGGAALDEFLGSDVVVVGAPLYNLTIPSQLKAWIDRICVAGKTFRYTPNGAEGLAGGKRVVLALSRGGFYGPGSKHAGMEHGESYLRTIFGFLGVANIEVIVAEGVALGAERRAQALEEAVTAAKALRPA